MIRVIVDYDRCASHGLCTLEAPDVFELDDDGKLAVPEGALSEEYREAVAAAASACPTGAITLRKF
jgi:ferredoxin